MINKKKEIIDLIKNSDFVDFSDYGEGVSEEWIRKAETYLGFLLPKTYKWWLRKYGGGEISGEEIYSIYELDFNSVVGGDIVYMARTNRETGLLTNDKIAICEPSSTNEIFYFKLSESVDGEYPVYVFDKVNMIEEKYADNFLIFLEKRIKYFKVHSH